jgi:hypothetical protein
MNKRLLLALYDRSGLGAYMPVDYKGQELEVEEHWEKFAELIVQECAEVARSNTRVDSKVYLMIQEHFGVEDRAVPILSADEQALFAGIASSKLFKIAGAKKQFGVEE